MDLDNVGGPMEISRSFDMRKKQLYIEKIDYSLRQDNFGFDVSGPEVFREVYDFSTGEAIFIGVEYKEVIPEKINWHKE